MNTSKKSVDKASALKRLEAQCARCEMCSFEALTKLSKMQLSKAEAEEVLASLQAHRFIDDDRFCEVFVRDKIRFGKWGKRKIRLALMQKRIPRQLADECLSRFDSEEYETILNKIAHAKARTIENLDSYEGRTKLFRYIVSRGFETDLAAKAVQGLTCGLDN